MDLLHEDFKLINDKQDDDVIQNTNSSVYKKEIKSKIREAAFKYLQNIKEKHSKIKHIKYQKLEVQKYMTSPIFSNKEVNTLYALRSRSTECKENFKQKYVNTNLLCPLCKDENESQQHILKCRVLLSKFETTNLTKENVTYEDLFSPDVHKQKVITMMFIELFELRKKLQENRNSQPAPSPTVPVELRMSNDLLDCTVYSSFGK